MQDFTTEGDIDWSKSVEEIDSRLYAKYNLSDEEIAFIKSVIKPMWVLGVSWFWMKISESDIIFDRQTDENFIPHEKTQIGI